MILHVLVSLVASLGWTHQSPGGLTQLSEPAVPFENVGACPFECCTYRTWTVESDTRILAARSDRAAVVFQAGRGERVEGLTGVVVTTAFGRAVISKPTTVGERHTSVQPGDRLLILHYVGEGFWKFWLRGIVDQDEIQPSPQCRNCDAESITCSDCDVQMISQPRTVWWAKIRNASGREGWTRELRHFGNIDACG